MTANQPADKPKLPKGFGLQLSIGTTYAGFYVRWSNMSFRVCLGWLAFTTLFYDFEPALSQLLKILKEQPHD